MEHQKRRFSMGKEVGKEEKEEKEKGREDKEKGKEGGRKGGSGVGRGGEGGGKAGGGGGKGGGGGRERGGGGGKGEKEEFKRIPMPPKGLEEEKATKIMYEAMKRIKSRLPCPMKYAHDSLKVRGEGRGRREKREK